MTAVEFWVPALPQVVLSTNGTRRQKRNRWTIAEAKEEIGSEAQQACTYRYDGHPPEIRGSLADIFIAFHVCHHRRKPECKRCLQRALEDQERRYDGSCLCYRPEDPSNIGGECIKSPVDYGLVKTGVLEDDTYEFVRFVTLHVEPVDSLADEGIHVRVSAVGAS